MNWADGWSVLPSPLLALEGDNEHFKSIIPQSPKMTWSKQSNMWWLKIKLTPCEGLYSCSGWRYFCRKHHGACENQPVQVVHYVGVFVFPHHQDLIDDQLFLGLLLQVHLFDGHLKTEDVCGSDDLWKQNISNETEWKVFKIWWKIGFYLLTRRYVDGSVDSARRSDETNIKNTQVMC